ncbi:hypothetical protein GALL_546500 [mine drainage metagenome]|uniref:Uncharacterized protein n=1 Tax=mine drainage metagenome TaxID=410659 RepID=A0A1J5NX43_9ZZZZ
MSSGRKSNSTRFSDALTAISHKLAALNQTAFRASASQSHTSCGKRCGARTAASSTFVSSRKTRRIINLA